MNQLIPLRVATGEGPQITTAHPRPCTFSTGPVRPHSSAADRSCSARPARATRSPPVSGSGPLVSSEGHGPPAAIPGSSAGLY